MMDQPPPNDWNEARMFVFDQLGRNETKADDHDRRLRGVEGSVAGIKTANAMRAALYGSLAASLITVILTSLGS